ncbi:calcium-binding protein [Actinoplanes sp. DH11]|uniref:calcium-binding protein n=1 Tax=Actinoplanes sp. DH11 TaxID=2857011 RepID=UPI001E3E43FC|nr:calcium-binding protein [Actinoplanes sp. DH11]
MKHTVRLATVTGLALLSTSLLSAPAQAAATGEARVSGRTVLYVAAKGKQNKVVVTRSGNTITVDDKVAVKAGKGCKKVKGDKTKVRCTPKKAPTRVDVYTADRADSIVNRSGVALIADGGSGNDSITGGPRGDYLTGGSGNDKMQGAGGSDNLSGSSGNDRLYGGAGSDYLYGRTGHDLVDGGNDRDYVGGGAGNDRLYGGAGDDTIGWDETDVSGADNDVYSGGAGNDALGAYLDYRHAVRIDLDGVADDGKSGEKDNVRTDIEEISGGPKNDRIHGSNRAEMLSGGGGNDGLYGNGGDDALDGGLGADVLDGGAGNDRMNGDFPGEGRVSADVLRGGAGVDLADYSNYTRAIAVDLDGAKGDDGQSGEKDTVGADVENVSSGSGHDRLTGNAAPNMILGGYGNDTIRGGGGNDDLTGDADRDSVYGEAGDDYLDGTDWGNTPEPDRLDGGANATADGDLCRPHRDDIFVSCERLV